MKYMDITIVLERCGIEPALAVLDTMGIDDAEVRDPQDALDKMAGKEEYEWDYVDESVSADLSKKPEIHIYHESGRDDDAFFNEIKDAMKRLADDFDAGIYGEGADPGDLEVKYEIRDDSAWKDKWKKYFKPTHISERIVVKPTWEEYTPDEGEIMVEIDPGMAFGTGTHETTSLCVKALEKYVKPGMSVLDAGCGSGILSIVAAKLGASDVLGVDIDEEAVRVSKENFVLNGTDDVCAAQFGDVTKGIQREAEGGTADGGEQSDEKYKADIVAANIMAELLCMIAKGMADHIKSGGLLISSGILNEKEEMVRDAYAAAGLTVTEVMHDGEWCCVIAEK